METVVVPKALPIVEQGKRLDVREGSDRSLAPPTDFALPCLDDPGDASPNLAPTHRSL